MAETKNLISSAPLLLVSDIKKSVGYYKESLGFSCDQIWGDPPTFAMPAREGLIIMLKQPSDPKKVRPNSAVDGAGFHKGETWGAYFWIKDADALFSEFKENGASVVYEPVIRELYGMKEFAVKDLDENVLAFGQDWP